MALQAAIDEKQIKARIVVATFEGPYRDDEDEILPLKRLLTIPELANFYALLIILNRRIRGEIGKIIECDFLVGDQCILLCIQLGHNLHILKCT